MQIEEKSETQEEKEENEKQRPKWRILFQRNGGHKGGIGQKYSRRKVGRMGGVVVKDTLRKEWERKEKENWRQEQHVSKEIKIMSNNIRGGLGTRAKEEELIRFLEREKPDVLMLQETKTMEGDI